MSDFIIYGLVDPRSGLLRYVGRSSNGLARPRRFHSARCFSWERSLKSLGLKKQVEVLEELEDGPDVNKRLNDVERWWIASVKAVGGELLNMTDGGGGMLNPCHETRQKMREAKLGVPRSPEAKDAVARGSRRTHAERPGRWWRPIRCLNDGAVFSSVGHAAEHYDIGKSTVIRVCRGARGQVETRDGLRFEYAGPIGQEV